MDGILVVSRSPKYIYKPMDKSFADQMFCTNDTP